MIGFFRQFFKRAKPPSITIDANEHKINFKDIDPNALKVLKGLDKAGHDAYLVGGAIRDLGSGLRTKDCDVVTAARPDKILKCFKRSVKIGKRFRLVHVYFGRAFIEVSTFRAMASRGREYSSKGMIKRDNVYGHINDDVLRRDFTINALYMRYKDGLILDYVGGWQDLKDKVLRSIGPADERFQEDPIRILRAIRFKAKLGLSFDRDIEQAIKRYANRLLDVPSQRLFIEITKIYYSGYAKAANTLMWDLGIVEILMPEIVKANKDLAYQLMDRMSTVADKRYVAKEKLSVAYLVAVLYWVKCEALMRQKRVRGFSSVLAKEVLNEAHIEIPPRVAEAVLEIWYLQFTFMAKEKATRRVEKAGRARAAYDLLVARATFQPKLSETAFFWAEYLD